MGQYTNHLKDKAIDNEEEYKMYAQEQLENGVESSKIMDIWTWLASEEAAAQEHIKDR